MDRFWKKCCLSKPTKQAMLAHLKAKPQEYRITMASDSIAIPGLETTQDSCSDPGGSLLSPDEKRDTQVTCDVLCSLSAAYPQGSASDSSSNAGVSEKPKSKTCPKQHQLPLFLSSTFLSNTLDFRLLSLHLHTRFNASNSTLDFLRNISHDRSLRFRNCYMVIER